MPSGGGQLHIHLSSPDPSPEFWTQIDYYLLDISNLRLKVTSNLMCPEQNFDFSSFISPSVFLFSTSVNTQPAKTKPHILPRLLPSSWSSCFCSSIQNSPKPSHLKITSKSRTRPMTGPPTHLSVTSSPPTSSLLTTLLPRCLHAARPTRRACFHPCPCLLFLEHPSPRYQSA